MSKNSLTFLKDNPTVAKSVVRVRTWYIRLVYPRLVPAGILMKTYLEWKESTTKNPTTVKMYGMWVKRFLDFIQGEPITLELVMDFKKYLVGREYSPKNIQYGLTLVRDYLGYEVSKGNLVFPLKLFRIPQERSNSHHAITQEEFDRMIGCLPSHETLPLQRKVMLSLLWDTGMRAGELLRLKLSDLKENRSAIIANEKNHRNRLVAWSPATERFLRIYLPLRKRLKTKDDHLFVSFHWKPHKKMSTRNLEHIFKEVCKKTGLSDTIRPHGMRHGFTHKQLHKRQPITTIAQMLGHSTIYNVLTYTQLNSVEIRDAWGIERQ